MPLPKKHKFDIFQVLGHISSKNVKFYDNLTDEEQKALQPLVVMRWLTGTRKAEQIYFLNELVNPFIFNMAKHKKLLIDLMSICSHPHRQYYWNKAKSKRTSSTPALVGLLRDYYGYSSREAIEALPILSDDQFLWFADELGKQPDEIKLIKKDLKTRSIK